MDRYVHLPLLLAPLYNAQQARSRTCFGTPPDGINVARYVGNALSFYLAGVIGCLNVESLPPLLSIYSTLSSTRKKVRLTSGS